jgi:hypothetical protein
MADHSAGQSELLKAVRWADQMEQMWVGQLVVSWAVLTAVLRGDQTAVHWAVLKESQRAVQMVRWMVVHWADQMEQMWVGPLADPWAARLAMLSVARMAAMSAAWMADHSAGQSELLKAALRDDKMEQMWVGQLVVSWAVLTAVLRDDQTAVHWAVLKESRRAVQMVRLMVVHWADQMEQMWVGPLADPWAVRLADLLAAH